MSLDVENYLPVIENAKGYYSKYPINMPVIDTGGQVYNVKGYGAKGDGITDDSPAIQALIGSIPSSGGVIYFPAGVYLLSEPLTITSQNTHVRGAGWSNPHPGETNGVSLGLPFVTLKPSANFTPNSFVITFNNTSKMINGCSFRDIAIDGSAVSAAHVSGVGGLHLGNAAFFGFQWVEMNDLTGSCILVDQAGATYSSPSTSQLWFNNFNLFNSSHHGIEFGHVFMTQVYISDFFIQNMQSAYGISFQQGDQAGDIHIQNGTIDTCEIGIYWTAGETFMHDLSVSGCWNYGLYVKQTQTFGYVSEVHHCIFRDNDKNVNGSPQVLIDTGTYDYRLSNNICDRPNNGSEIGIKVVDGFGVHGVTVDNTNYSSGHATANFVNGSTNITATTPQLKLAASVTGMASLNIPSGTAPSSPNDGDIWYDGTNVKIRVGGTTKTFTIT